MRSTYDPKVDAAYLYFSSGKVTRTVRVTDSVLVDLTDEGALVGVELLAASKQIDISTLKELVFDEYGEQQVSN